MGGPFFSCWMTYAHEGTPHFCGDLYKANQPLFIDVRNLKLTVKMKQYGLYILVAHTIDFHILQVMPADRRLGTIIKPTSQIELLHGGGPHDSLHIFRKLSSGFGSLALLGESGSEYGSALLIQRAEQGFLQHKWHLFTCTCNSVGQFCKYVIVIQETSNSVNC